MYSTAKGNIHRVPGGRTVSPINSDSANDAAELEEKK